MFDVLHLVRKCRYPTGETCVRSSLAVPAFATRSLCLFNPPNPILVALPLPLTLAHALSHVTVPTPAPPKAATASPGTSVAERLAKMRRGSAGHGGGVSGSNPSSGGSPKKSGLARSFTPPSAPTVNKTQSPGGGQGIRCVKDVVGAWWPGLDMSLHVLGSCMILMHSHALECYGL